MSENIPDDMVDSGPADQTSSSRSFQKSTSTGSLDFHMEALNLKSDAPMLDEWSSDIVDLDDSALSSTSNGPKSRSPRSPGKGASRTRSSGILRRRPTPQIEVFQSITCMPAHRQRSFEVSFRVPFWVDTPGCANPCSPLSCRSCAWSVIA